jgi:hypothetical protein
MEFSVSDSKGEKDGSITEKDFPDARSDNGNVSRYKRDWFPGARKISVAAH